MVNNLHEQLIGAWKLVSYKSPGGRLGSVPPAGGKAHGHHHVHA